MRVRTHAHHHHHFSLNRFFLAALLFTGAYMITINIGHAQGIPVAPEQGIHLGENGLTAINGRIKDIKDGYLLIDSAGKDMKIDLKDIELASPADTVFKVGMNVSVSGKMNGDDFGVPVVDAKTVTATEASPVTQTAPPVLAR